MSIHAKNLAACISCICAALTVFASPVLMVESSVVSGLFNGEVELLSHIKLKGDQYFQGDNGSQRGFAYYGYRYGQAKRFQDSVENTDFSYLQNPDRPKLGHVCPQLPKLSPGLAVFHRNLSFNEDCLYLDVYVPPLYQNQSKTWPVLFWIYGGGFVLGDKNLYNGSILARSVDAIVVTINYRLTLFGFLSTGDSAAGGNWAIGDIKLALNWTRSNIASFNGDPAKITIFGESAGGALVSALMLDDQVLSEVFAAVAMSGSILMPWAFTSDPLPKVNLVAEKINCPTDTTSDLVACLQSQTVEQLLNATRDVQRDIGARLTFPLVVDGKHIPKNPVEILTDRTKESHPKPQGGTFIMGYLKEDTSFFLLGSPHMLNATLNLTTVNQLLTPSLKTAVSDCAKNSELQLQLILDYYGLSESNSSSEMLQSYFEISTDMMFALGTVAESLLYANSSRSNSQLYLISFDPAYKNLGSFHFMDVLHLFRGYMDIKMKDKMSDPLTAAIHDFFRQVAHNGRFDGPSFGPDGNYLELNQEAKWVAKRKHFLPLLAFWEKIKNLECSSVDPDLEYRR